MANINHIYVGAESIISPLGTTAEENFNQAKNGQTALQKIVNPFANVPKLFAAKIATLTTPQDFETLCLQTAKNSLQKISTNEKGRWAVVFSTTKGNIFKLKNKDFDAIKTEHLAKKLQETLPKKGASHVISVACISGLAATIYAADLIALNHADNVLVVGADALSEFTATGFQSFYALAPGQCKPFDANREGLNLGEAAASVIVSNNKTLFSEKPVQYLGGATSNDANHISGPSRTGEGLYRATQRALSYAQIDAKNIDYISAHGTGTRYNDDMESIAFKRLQLAETPLNSLKGYFGHTLGASSLVEIAMSLQSVKHSLILKNYGIETPGTAEKINIATQNIPVSISHFLKTASGFGGCNGAAVFKTLTA